MSLVLQDEVLADVVLGDALPWRPRVAISGLSLMVGPYASGEEHEKHVLETKGSGGWYRSEYDELRFNSEDGLLESLWCHVPEVNVRDDPDMSHWTGLPPVIGGLRLVSEAYFELRPTGERWYSGRDELLVCVQSVPRCSEQRLRLRVAHNVDLLFADNRLCGWLLAEPARFLVQSWEYPPVAPDDAELAVLLGEYLDVVAHPYTEQMQDQGTVVRGMLEMLSRRISEKEGAIDQRVALRKAVDDLVSFFYD